VQVEAGIPGQRQVFRGNLQLARGLFDERARAAAAGRLHVHLFRLACAAGREEQRLHVLPADLGDEIHARVKPLDRSGYRDDLLDHFRPDERREQPRARTGHIDPVASGRQATIALHANQELEEHFCLPGVVAKVVLPAHRAAFQHRAFDRGRADIEADGQHPARCSA
jgi:hypothetical protein